jgi:hypothetical protein
MKILAIIPLVLLSACSAVPVTATFPEAPPSLVKTCPELQRAPQTTKLSEMLLTITANYGLYHECQTKVDSWIDWYNKQRKIFNGLK